MVRRRFRASIVRKEGVGIGVGIEEIEGVNSDTKAVYIASLFFEEGSMTKRKLAEYVIDHVKDIVGDDEAVLRLSSSYRSLNVSYPNIKVRSCEKKEKLYECGELAHDAICRRTSVTEYLK
jgi:hypothetical protein